MDLNERLRDGQTYETIIEWLHSTPAAVEALRQYSGDRWPVSAQNLSNYRASAPYLDWERKSEALAASAARRKFVLETSAEAGLNLMDAGDSMVASHLLEMLEGAEGEEAIALVKAFAGLRTAATGRAALDLRTKELEAQLRRMADDAKRAEITAVKKFMEWAGRAEAQAILGGGEPKAVQMDLLHALLFPGPAGSTSAAS
jgi:hypothetical protein